MEYLENVIYLEGSDFDQNLNLKYEVHTGQPSVVMIQGLFCGACSQAKPYYHQFCLDPNTCQGFTIQVELEQDLAQKLAQKCQASGIPLYLKFNSQGKLEKHHVGALMEPPMIVEFSK